MTARARLLLRAALVLGGIVLAFGLAEIACRIDALFPGQKYTSAGARLRFSVRAEAAEHELEAYAAPEPKAGAGTLNAFLHPFLGWSDTRSFETLAEETNWYSKPKSDQTFDVLVLGGSVAADFGNRERRKLIELLQADSRLSARHVRVWNEGHAGYKEPQPLHALEWMIAMGHRPDAVVLIDGFNEVAIACSNVDAQVHPLYPYAENWGVLVRGKGIDVQGLDFLLAMRAAQSREQALARRALDRGYAHSALLTRLTLSRMAHQRRAFEAARDAYLAYLVAHTEDPAVRGPPYEGDARQALDVAVRCWTESARALHDLCARRGLVEVHVLQPALEDAGAKQLTTKELHNTTGGGTWTTAVRTGYPLLRQAGAALAAEGLPFDDATRLFEHESESVYVDMCHLNERGNDMMAGFVAERLLQRLH